MFHSAVTLRPRTTEVKPSTRASLHLERRVCSLDTDSEAPVLDRPSPGDCAEYYFLYIDRVPNGNVLGVLDNQLQKTPGTLTAMPADKLDGIARMPGVDGILWWTVVKQGVNPSLRTKLSSLISRTIDRDATSVVPQEEATFDLTMKIVALNTGEVVWNGRGVGRSMVYKDAKGLGGAPTKAVANALDKLLPQRDKEVLAVASP